MPDLTKKWRETDDMFLRDNYANNTNINIGKAIGRTAQAVFTRARLLGLKKSPEFLSANIHKAQNKSVANNRKTKEYHNAHDREYRRNRRAWLKANDKEGYERLLERQRAYRKKLYYDNLN